MRVIYLKDKTPHVLGTRGDHAAACIRVNVDAWLAEYPSGHGGLIFTSPEQETYPLDATTNLYDGVHYLEAVITSDETHDAGWCVIRAAWYDGETMVYSRPYYGKIMENEVVGAEEEGTMPDWVATLIQELADAKEAIQNVDRAIEAEDNAEQSALDAEAWAVGERDGEDVDEDDPTYGNNARKYAQDAGGSAAAAGVYKQEAEAWAKGTKNGQAVPSTDPAYQKNAKYYAEQAFSGTPEGYADLVGDVGDLKSALNNVEDRLISFDGTIVIPQFENGSVYANNGVLDYSNNSKRIRFPRGEYVELVAGDKIKVSGSGYIVGVNHSTDDGATYVWDGSVNGTTTVQYTGRYVLFIQAPSDVTDVKETQSHLTISRSGSQKEKIYSMSADISSLQDEIAYGNNNVLNGVTWEQGGVTQNGEYSDNKVVRTGYLDLRMFSKVIFSCESGYRFFYLTYDNDKTFISAISYSTTEQEIARTTNEICYARVVLRHTDNTSTISTTEGTNMNVVGENAFADIPKLSKRINIVENLFRFKPFYSHLGVDQTTNIIIPSQSISDVLRTRRLGFNGLELNVQKTSDNKYVCLHGTGGKFGAQFIGEDSSDVSDIAVSSKTLDWIKTNVRYVSKYTKYQTAPFTLEEMLYECKKLCIVPLIQYVDMTMVGIANSIMGADNYVLLLYGNDRGGKTEAVCMSWTAYADVEDAIDKCKASGQCYILGVNHGASVFNNYSDDDWKNYIKAVHAAGYYIVGAYINATTVPKFRQFGWDVIASTVQINEIDSGNICNLFSDLNYTDFLTNGTVSNGTLTLSVGQQVTPNATYQSVFLGGGSLHIRFSGRIYINMGKINISYTSDGGNDVWFSTYFEEQVPTFTVTAATETVIYELSYKASRM